MSIDAKKTTSLVHVLESLAPHAMPDREFLHGSERRLFDQALAELSWRLRDLVFFFFAASDERAYQKIRKGLRDLVIYIHIQKATEDVQSGKNTAPGSGDF
jgi:hypothetical protein